MSRGSRFLAGFCVAAGVLLSYAAASGQLNPAQWAKAAPGQPQAAENAAAADDDSACCCFGSRRRHVVVVAAAEPRAEAAPREEEPKPEPGKGKRAKEFIAAFERGDAKAVAAFWTETADYVDETGREYKGRPAIEKMYEKFFAGKKGLKLNIIVTGARMVGSDTALGRNHRGHLGRKCAAEFGSILGGPGEKGRRMVLRKRARFGAPPAV